MNEIMITTNIELKLGASKTSIAEAGESTSNMSLTDQGQLSLKFRDGSLTMCVDMYEKYLDLGFLEKRVLHFPSDVKLERIESDPIISDSRELWRGGDDY